MLVSHLAYERKAGNRYLVLSRRPRPFTCEACAFSFGTEYGHKFADYIQVHHLNPVSGGARAPRHRDFALLCANCHAMAHWRMKRRPRSVAELRRLRKAAGRLKAAAIAT